MSRLVVDRLTKRWSALRVPPRTIRLRLTAVYGGLFLIGGAALLVITYFLVRRQYTNELFLSSGKAAVLSVVGDAGSAPVQAQKLTTIAPTPGEIVAAASAQSDAALRQLLISSGIALAIMAVLSIWLGWLMAGRALRPLRTITSAAREISASNLHRRLALDGPDDELKRLGDTFDALLERLQRAFDAQRRFVANASHELRTPLTLERALVEVALADPNATVETLRQTCEQVLAAGEQQERLIEALLTLSRSQRGLDRREAVNLAAIARAKLALIEPDGFAVEATLDPARTSGDPRLVERLVANLIDNAVQHNSAGGWIDVATDTDDGHAVLVVTNSGPVVPAEQLERLFQPFQRLDEERTTDADGVRLGLGLSIVQAIAEAHGADLVANARPEGGLQIEVRFPSPSSIRLPG
ncbi:MAG TPA: ATP-binding protein [Gaiellaceae bacterium]|nr:ATP-binding protein [Gaiellaceae bacterium]